MKITPLQRTTLMKIWGRVCKDRGWKTSDRDFRLAKWSELLGRRIESADEVGRIDECTKLMNELKVMLGVSVQAARESDDLTINQARVLRNQIAGELIPCLELYVADVRGYLTEIIESKSRYRKTDRPTRDLTLMDLDAGQLRHIQFTLAARLNEKRRAAGDSIHDMRKRACVPCGCAKCRKPVFVADFIAPLHGPAEAVSKPF